MATRMFDPKRPGFVCYLFIARRPCENEAAEAGTQIDRGNVTDDELMLALEKLRGLLTTVATGGARIDDVDSEYRETLRSVAADLARRRIENPVTFETQWEWHSRWSSGDLPTYKSRRLFVAELVNPIIQRIRTGRVDAAEPTGWQRVDRGVGALRDQFADAKNSEDFQTVGLLGREVLISLAQAVYVRERHPPLDGTEPSPTDAKRMLEAYIAVELAGGANDESRKHARSALDLAVALQHRRTATFRDAKNRNWRGSSTSKGLSL